jgi:putative two-component system response regulator
MEQSYRNSCNGINPILTNGVVNGTVNGTATSATNGATTNSAMPTLAALNSALLHARILIVDDEPSNVLLLERVLEQAGFTNLVSTTDSREVAALCEAQPPDIVLLDLMMPYLDGFGVMQWLRENQQLGCYLPILVLTADSSAQTKRRALTGGAKDFLIKPLDHTEVLLRVQNLLETRFLYCQLKDRNLNLEERVEERTRELQIANTQLLQSFAELQESKIELELSQLEILDRLARAAEFRDDDTGQHTHRVGQHAALLAQRLGLSTSHIELIRRAAPLHDVGKIGVSDTILLKPGKLTPEEFATMKTHTTIGGQLLADGHSPFVRAAQTIALSHHERWDGTGYPQGLAGESIPVEGRIVAVADVFDALTHDRPYKKAWPVEEALEEIKNQSGRQFDPSVVEAFLEVVK